MCVRKVRTTYQWVSKRIAYATAVSVGMLNLDMVVAAVFEPDCVRITRNVSHIGGVGA